MDNITFTTEGGIFIREGNIAKDKVNCETHIISAFEMLRFVTSKSFFGSFSTKW